MEQLPTACQVEMPRDALSATITHQSNQRWTVYFVTKGVHALICTCVTLLGTIDAEQTK